MKIVVENKGKFVKVYRLENESGLGPYVDDSFSDWGKMMGSHRNAKTHPPLHYDFSEDEQFIIQSKNYKFGFSSIKNLKDWFGEFLPKLLKEGFKINTYEIPSYRVITSKSKKQVAFK